MFLKYRIRKLQIKVDGQKAETERLEVAERDYGVSYYTNKLIESHRAYVELNSHLEFLKGKVKCHL
jgi:hypothetical protein